MNRLFSKKVYFFILALGVLLLPQSVFASTVYIDTNRTDFFVGDTILVRVRIDSENKSINAIEGQVALNYSADAISLTDINTAGSKFSLWPSKPFPSDDNTSISFIGGTPGGFVSKDAIVFNVALKLQEAGQLTLSPKNIAVYLHDGKGSRDFARVKDLVINVLPEGSGTRLTDEWSGVISDDKTKPESFDVVLGKDPSLFDNQYFISFFTTDAESGVAYYEVQEGRTDFVRAESPYMLKDQSVGGRILVKAVDKAGNERIAELRSSDSRVVSIPLDKDVLPWIAVILLIILAIVYILWKAVWSKK